MSFSLSRWPRYVSFSRLGSQAQAGAPGRPLGGSFPIQALLRNLGLGETGPGHARFSPGSWASEKPKGKPFGGGGPTKDTSVWTGTIKGDIT